MPSQLRSHHPSPGLPAWQAVRTAGRGLLGGWVGVLIDVLSLAPGSSPALEDKAPRQPQACSPLRTRRANSAQRRRTRH